jgi:hypothetical protein
MANKLNEIVARILTDTTSLSDQQQAELRKAMDTGDLLVSLVETKKITTGRSSASWVRAAWARCTKPSIR